MGNGVETSVDSAPSPSDRASVALSVRLLGPLSIVRDGVPVPLPASRKVRALFAYLALSTSPIGRSRLCDLLWDAPNDPRGELRWCLSKLRNVLDEPDHRRVQASDDRVALDLKGCHVDAIEVASAAEEGLKAIELDRLRSLAGLFAGDFLEGLEIDRNPNFGTWLTAQRRRFTSCHAVILEQLVARLPSEPDETSAYLEKWVELAPFDHRAHAMLLSASWRTTPAKLEPFGQTLSESFLTSSRQSKRIVP